MLASWSDAEQLLTRDCRFVMILMDWQKPGIVSGAHIGAVDHAGSLEGIEIIQIIEKIRDSEKPHMTPILVLNTQEGFSALLARIGKLKQANGKTDVVFGMEPTGHYWLPMAQFLREAGIRVVVVNPMHVKKS